MRLDQLKSKCVTAPDVLLIRSCLAQSPESLKVPLSCQKTLSLCVRVFLQKMGESGEKKRQKGRLGGKVGEVSCWE